METLQLVFIISMPLVAIALTVVKTKSDAVSMRILKFLGILVSSMPIIGIVQGFIVKKRSPLYSQACFAQAIYCGLGFVLIFQVLPDYL